MNDIGPGNESRPSVRLVDREVQIPKRPAIEAADIRLTALLPIYAAIAWFVSASHWHGLMRRLASIDAKGSLSTITRGIDASGLEARLPGGKEEIAGELNVNRLESYVQYLRDYRPGGWRAPISIDNEIALRRGLEAGRGVILWVGHFVFNGLPLKKALGQAGYSVHHLSRPEHGFSSSRYGIKVLNPVRSHIEERYLAQRVMIERGAEHRAIREAHRLLSKGEIISITAGHWEGKRIAYAPIGNAGLPISIGAPSLANSTGATLLPLFIARDRPTGDAGFRVIVGDPIDCSQANSRDESVRAAVGDFARQLVPLVQKYPDQWRGWKYLTANAD
jgi:lauroyl/myristoyl acyltransferase